MVQPVAPAGCAAASGAVRGARRADSDEHHRDRRGHQRPDTADEGTGVQGVGESRAVGGLGLSGAGAGLEGVHEQRADAADHETGDQEQAGRGPVHQPPGQRAEHRREAVDGDETDADVQRRGVVDEPEVLAQREDQADLGEQGDGHDERRSGERRGREQAAAPRSAG
ncbi:hypothetical protein [Streptomyces sp. NPDC048385]|uniref:hypothetical protein n=1 Tax=unclassified Streptomyces TaxID=2593676 RepID=UPI0034455F2A